MRHVDNRHKDLRPLTEPVLLILMSLADSPRHGYAILKDVSLISQGRVRLSTGTLYEALRRLLTDGLIERFEQPDTSREKQSYRITAAGHERLVHELDRLRQITEAATRLRLHEVHT